MTAPNGVIQAVNNPIFAQQRSLGNINGFGVTPASGLNPTIIPGTILHQYGLRELTDADFDTIGPDGDGSVSDDDVTALFYSVTTDAVYSNLTGAKVAESDIFLGAITAASTNITEWAPGQIANVHRVGFEAVAVDSTGDKKQVVFRGDGLSRKLLHVELVPIANITTTAPVISIQKIDAVTGTNTVLAALTAATASFDLDALGNVQHLGLSADNLSAVANNIKDGDQIVIEVTTASAAGDADIYLVFGGAVTAY